MKDILIKFKSAGIMLLTLLIFLFVVSLLNLLGVLGSTVSAVINMLIGVFMMFASGYVGGMKREEKGYIAGLKIGFITLIVIFLISLIIFNVKPNIAMLIYYIILLLAVIFGSMVGINKKKK